MICKGCGIDKGCACNLDKNGLCSKCRSKVNNSSNINTTNESTNNKSKSN